MEPYEAYMKRTKNQRKLDKLMRQVNDQIKMLKLYAWEPFFKTSITECQAAVENQETED